ncbi:acyclic terpene utilization AtuA family protein [Variovorax saccharolyticus]|uniref:acyclic terpene utilization AtuA family protein n=1 Tax=Variovorax saccharolyticus TaxID=3053516 RepID=UPI00257831EB|nr:acyclic terpene utilization AtuA family protein [Variovorax sp. J22R187]MDM0018473.1 acyclic terpene utilization AtuA family protein [Variovorax sp. J22R187]
MSKTIRIGGASGFWGDSAIATPQLLTVPGLRYLVYDYLAETTMSILARARAKDPALGYATDFVHAAMAPNLAAICAKGVRVIANAGGLNPQACRDALAEVALKQGLSPRIAVVTGDDLMPQFEALRAQGVRDLHTGEAPPAELWSANAYVGARGIAQALERGADIVITGRCVDSAVVVGVLAHEFGWRWDDWDRIAAGTLAGHVIECGAQATGGLFTDWQQVPGWADMGYPVIDCEADGTFKLTKPEGSGGLIHPGAVAEQILYEVGDPAHYLMPDVSCDFRQVQVQAMGPEVVRVSGARGRAPTGSYKANGTWRDGYQLQIMMAIRGIEAPAKARKTADALLSRTRAQLRQRGMADYTQTCVELLGCESLYGPNARPLAPREVVLRIAARHPDPKALAFLQRECASAGTSMGPGTRSSFAGRADVQPVIKVFSFLVAKERVAMQIEFGGVVETVAAPATGPAAAPEALPTPAGATLPGGDAIEVPLVALAWARSGDKGDDENIGVIARRREFLPLLRAQLDAAQVRAYFAHLVAGEVERFDVPGLQAMNFVLHRALDGGGVASLRSDPLGKSFAQMLLDHPIRIPRQWIEDGLVAADRS